MPTPLKLGLNVVVPVFDKNHEFNRGKNGLPVWTQFLITQGTKGNSVKPRNKPISQLISATRRRGRRTITSRKSMPITRAASNPLGLVASAKPSDTPAQLNQNNPALCSRQASKHSSEAVV